MPEVHVISLVLSLTSSDPADSALLASTQEEDDVAEEDKEAMESSQPDRPTYEECFLSGHNHPVTVSLRWRDYEPYSGRINLS